MKKLISIALLTLITTQADARYTSNPESGRGDDLDRRRQRSISSGSLNIPSLTSEEQIADILHRAGEILRSVSSGIGLSPFSPGAPENQGDGMEGAPFSSPPAMDR